MKTKMTLVWLALLVIGGLMASSPAQANWLIRPRGGVTINDSGDAYGTVGGSFGYQFLDFISAEAGYSRIFSGPDIDLFEATSRIKIPILPIYGLAGIGASKTDISGSDWESAFRLGAGFYIPFIPIFHIGGEVSYLNLGGENLVEPVVMVGVNF